jgi:membrane fusion protein (multidrug efflux system)
VLKRSVLIPIAILLVAAGLFFTIRSQWTPWEASARTERTDDAYVRADQTPLSTRVSGTVRRVYVGDYQAVTAGQPLVDLDDADYQAVVAEAKAALQGAKAEYIVNQSAKRAADASIAAATQGIAGAQAGSTATQSTVASAQADLSRADSEFRRQQALLASRAATHQQFEEAELMRSRAAAEVAGRQADLERSATAVASARSALAGALQQRAALDAKDAVLLAQIESRKAAITVAEVNLGYTRISAPSTGTVGEFRVHPGQLVGAGVEVVDLVQSGVWIQANYRETQLGRVRPGSPVDVRIDALPGHLFNGHVAEISPASGSQFALLPPDNATGNYTRIVQRVPVRINLDPDPATRDLRPGFSATVTIHPSSALSAEHAALTSANPR